VKIILLSDIHGNLEALESVCESVKEEDADKVYCLGDVVGYGADPEACLRMVDELGWENTFGNHDEAVLNPAGLNLMNPVARAALEWTRENISPEGLKWLEGMKWEVAPFEGAVASHALPLKHGSWLYSDDPNLVRETFATRPESIIFVGHLHFAHAWHLKNESEELKLVKVPEEIKLDDGKWLINVGSVGQPRDGDHRACYVVYEDAGKTVTYRRIQYDTVTAAKKIVDAGLPEVLAKRLFLGQ